MRFEEKVKDKYMKAKEIVMYLFKTIKHQNISFKNTQVEAYYNQDKSLEIICNGKSMGYILLFNSRINSYVGKKKVVVAIDLDFNSFMAINKDEKIFKEISKYPVVNLDYTILANKDFKYQDILNILDEFKNKLIMKREFIDVYNDHDKLKYTIRYEVGSLEKTLESEELERFKNKFIKHISEKGLEIIS